MAKKLLSNKGETIVETLVALAICVICIAFLTETIVKAEVVNAKLRNFDYSFKYVEEYQSSQLTIDYTTLTDRTFDIKEKTDNGFNYYEK